MALPPIYQAPIDGLEKSTPLKVAKSYPVFLTEETRQKIKEDERRKKRDRRQRNIPVVQDRRNNERRKQDLLKQRFAKGEKKADPDSKIGQIIDEVV